jgi:hypothetical protein
VPDGPAAARRREYCSGTFVMTRAAASLFLTLVQSSGCSPAAPTAAEPQTTAPPQAAMQPQTAHDRQAPVDKSVASWTATAAMVADVWLDATVPRAYALRTLQTATKRVRARAQAEGAERRAAAIEHLRSAIEQDVAGDVRRALRKLRQ